jgi:hypothetical protein
MTFAVVFLLSLLVALVRTRGRPEVNRAIRLRGLALIFSALLLQVAEVYWPGSLPASARVALLGISLVCLAIVIVLNRSYRAIWLIGAGLLLNGLVMALNGGFMPVAPATLAHIGHLSLAGSLRPGTLVQRSKDVLLPPHQTRLWFLSDAIPIPPPIGVAFSIGDVLVAMGLFVLVQQVLRRRTGHPLPSGKQVACSDRSGVSEQG